jgi:hypothetical protein
MEVNDAVVDLRDAPEDGPSLDSGLDDVVDLDRICSHRRSPGVIVRVGAASSDGTHPEQRQKGCSDACGRECSPRSFGSGAGRELIGAEP